MFPVYSAEECGIRGCRWKRSVPEAAAVVPVRAAGNSKSGRLRAAPAVDTREVVPHIVRGVHIPVVWADILRAYFPPHGIQVAASGSFRWKAPRLAAAEQTSAAVRLVAAAWGLFPYHFPSV